MTVLYLLAEEIAGRDLTILGLFQHADIVVKCIIIGLLSASVVCWAMTFEKLIRVWLVNREIKQLEKSGQTGTLPAAKSSGLIRAIIDAARTEWTEGAHDGSTGEVRDRLEIAMRSATKRQLKGIEQGLPFLATLGSAAPFIGLFGTVWGIMNSFTAIAQSKDTSLAVVAPGIAEALFATAVGLAAAIPAVIFYNQITVALGRAADRAAPAIVGLARSLSRSGVEGAN
ncbi:TolQ protein [Hyphomicrobium sp. GJ21]|uniref:MotA/TolQ/ExbB proton channel family protein n=1 Tax=Hyphomicrobium sp. GJ21 TaxID=113574 RepID=UPI000622B852|nr:MotA/TolQ/ExbB proton channel family protein [Hyphomicrobium sp. GJ21]MBN9354179.1 MotA/TolQ/ExbB proton channel family protein [Hyphomicrobium denitrificans]CEJ87107.1 TolQ protein [Hyphomicrobium sp. GJ21]